MFLLFFFTRGMAMYLRASRGEVTVNGQIFPFLSNSIQMRMRFFLLFIFLLRIRLLE